MELTSTFNHQPKFFSSLRILRHASVTPITNIIINLELLERNLEPHRHHSNNHYYLRRAMLSAHYLKRIMQQTQKQTRQQQFIVKDAIQEVLALCPRPSQSGQLIPFIKVEQDLQIKGKKIYFQEALICLLNNAFQAYRQQVPNKLVVLYACRNKQGLLIKIADGGKGFHCLQDKSIPYQVSGHHDQQQEQFGTGLKFVKQVIQNHFSGQLKIESYPEKGTTIHCSLPIAK